MPPIPAHAFAYPGPDYHHQLSQAEEARLEAQREAERLRRQMAEQRAEHQFEMALERYTRAKVGADRPAFASIPEHSTAGAMGAREQRPYSPLQYQNALSAPAPLTSDREPSAAPPTHSRAPGVTERSLAGVSEFLGPRGESTVVDDLHLLSHAQQSVKATLPFSSPPPKNTGRSEMEMSLAGPSELLTPSRGVAVFRSSLFEDAPAKAHGPPRTTGVARAHMEPSPVAVHSATAANANNTIEYDSLLDTSEFELNASELEDDSDIPIAGAAEV